MEEEFDKDIEKKPKKWGYKRIYFFIVIELIIYKFMSIFDRCTCGLPMHNRIISKIVVLTQIIIDFIFNISIINKSKEKSKSKTLLLIINIVLLIVFLVGLVIIPFDHDEYN